MSGDDTSGMMRALMKLYAVGLREKLEASYCLVQREERRARRRTLRALSVELARLEAESIQAVGLGESILDDVIEGDWEAAEDIADELAREQPTRWSVFALILKTKGVKQ